MRERSLLDIIGQMDDDFIAEAANPEILLAAQRRRRRMVLVKRISGIAASALIAISLVLAIPMIRLMPESEADLSVSIENSIEAAIVSVQLNSAAADMSVLEDAATDQRDQEKAKAEADANAAQAEEAFKMAEAAAQKATAASKAASEAAAKTSNMTTSTVENSESMPITECERIGAIEFFYSDHMLLSLSVDSGYRLISLVIPSEIGGVQITSLGQDFWCFCDSNTEMEQVRIPDAVVSFGDISYLSKSVEVICGKGSAAEIFFYNNGYQVKYP